MIHEARGAESRGRCVLKLVSRDPGDIEKRRRLGDRLLQEFRIPSQFLCGNKSRRNCADGAGLAGIEKQFVQP